MTRDRRLLIVTDSLAAGLGGIVLEQVEWFQSRGWEVRVVAREIGPEFPLPIEIDLIEIPLTARNVRQLLAAGRELRRICATWQPAIVHCHGMRSFAVAVFAGRRGIAHLHGSGSIPSNPNVLDPLRRAFVRLLPRLAAGAYSASPEAGTGWTFAPIASPRLATFDRLPFPEPDGTPTFLWLGRLDEQKRADLFIEALATAARTTPMRGIVAGMGTQLEELRLRAERLDAPVEFVGLQTDVVPLLGDAWALVLLTRFEGMPLAVEEAMWAGRTVVGSRIPPLEWLVDGAGILVESHEEAVSAMLALTDAARAEELGLRAATRIRELLTADRPWREFEERYETLRKAG